MTDTDETTTTGSPLFQPGATAVRRDVHAGRVWTAKPQRVVADTGHVLTLACWPGIEGLAPTTWTEALCTGDDTVREQGLHHLAAGTWTLGPHRWERTAVLSHYLAGEWFSVHCFQDAATGTPISWYVNFELPYRRRPGGIDTMDLALDLVATPDLTDHHFKDRDEYARLRRLGVVDDHLDRQVQQACGRAIAMLDNHAGPFATGWPAWTPDPSWPLPLLPDGADRETEPVAPYQL
ncbi:DUF402 domain-containing protein [Kitasatospora sp. CB01950]|uniref:DUF402 domain-containing protein n=1 Tax=Kitasatospora sp. CB01950 TaxID=1703930 RepID=UPI00093F6B5C|nr:DUF402 domain-containing protein [Kitasatospora sp. CB01950]OKI95101.1 hypothetical protein AMK19_33065 [Kitasatospora sp. CB01950]